MSIYVEVRGNNVEKAMRVLKKKYKNTALLKRFGIDSIIKNRQKKELKD